MYYNTRQYAIKRHKTLTCVGASENGLAAGHALRQRAGCVGPRRPTSGRSLAAVDKCDRVLAVCVGFNRPLLRSAQLREPLSEPRRRVSFNLWYLHGGGYFLTSLTHRHLWIIIEVPPNPEVSVWLRQRLRPLQCVSRAGRAPSLSAAASGLCGCVTAGSQLLSGWQERDALPLGPAVRHVGRRHRRGVCGPPESFRAARRGRRLATLELPGSIPSSTICQSAKSQQRWALIAP